MTTEPVASDMTTSPTSKLWTVFPPGRPNATLLAVCAADIVQVTVGSVPAFPI